MANFKHGYSRASGSKGGRDKHRFDKTKYENSWDEPGYNWTSTYPRWHDIIYHTRPRRRRDKATLSKVMHGADPDNLVWELGNHKPHVYYW